ncbi:MAG: MFS transporter [Deltaproteobacteria bacterium]|nr:MFS transporter [Deltaproteobacteria bacterium]MBW2131894.1 MFS transporter [Deltaproteobacteria bacterium]
MGDSKEHGLDKDEKRIIKLTTTSHFLVHLFEGVLPPLIPLLIMEFSTDYFHLGLVVTVFSYAFGIGSLPSGYLADRIGPRRLITFFLFGAGILAIGVWPTGALIHYGILMGGIGLFCSTYHPASNTLISLAILEKGKAFGIHGIAGSLGVASVPLLSAWIGSTLGWRTPHVVYGVIGILVGMYSLTIPRYPATREKRDAEKTEKPPFSISYLNLIVFFLSAMALGLTYKGIMTFLPAYMGESIHMAGLKLDKVALGGTVATIALLSGALGQYVAGRGVDRIQAERLYLGAILLGTVFVFLMAAASNLILVLSAMMYAFFYFSTQPMQNYLLSTYLPRHRHGLGYGIHFFITFGVGSTAAAVSGYLADHFGLRSVFYAMGGCFLFSSAMAAVLLFRVNRRTRL